jgi:hypothetical protein
VGSLVTIGSTNPSPSAVEQLAEAITGHHVPPLPPWYERHAATHDTMDGPVLTEVDDTHTRLPRQYDGKSGRAKSSRRLDAPAALTGRPPTRLTCW